MDSGVSENHYHRDKIRRLYAFFIPFRYGFKIYPAKPVSYFEVFGPLVDLFEITRVAFVGDGFRERGEFFSPVDVRGGAVGLDEVVPDAEAEKAEVGVVHEIDTGIDMFGSGMAIGVTQEVFRILPLFREGTHLDLTQIGVIPVKPELYHDVNGKVGDLHDGSVEPDGEKLFKVLGRD